MSPRHASETYLFSLIMRLFKSSCSLLSKAIKRSRTLYFTWNVFCYATYMFKMILFCLANKSALHSHSSSIMTRFWCLILVRESIECQSSSQPRNAPFPQHRDFQIGSDVLSPPVSLSHYSYCLRLTFPSRHYGSPNRKCTTAREVEWTSYVQVHCWDKVLLNRVSPLKQSTKPWIENELRANFKTTVREAQLWINHEWDCIICCLSQDVTANCLRSTK